RAARTSASASAWKRKGFTGIARAARRTAAPPVSRRPGRCGFVPRAGPLQPPTLRPPLPPLPAPAKEAGNGPTPHAPRSTGIPLPFSVDPGLGSCLVLFREFASPALHDLPGSQYSKDGTHLAIGHPERR